MAGQGGAAIRAFFDEATNTVSYLVWDPATMRGAVIDPVLDWDNRSGEADLKSAQALLDAAKAEGVAAYMVFADRTLVEMAERRPQSPAALKALHGVGERKLQRYGSLFLAEIDAFLARRSA